MFEWQKKKIKEIENTIDSTTEELKKNNMRKKSLEKNNSVKSYLELLRESSVKEYIDLIDKCKSQEKSLIKDKELLKKYKEDICPNKILLFMEDVTTNHQLIGSNVKYYKCICLECGVIADFQFINEKREGTTLINIGEIELTEADEFLKTYKYLKSSELDIENIIELLKRKNNQIRTKKRRLNKENI